MHPSPVVCEKLAKHGQWLRLGWLGRERAFAGEQNPGSFAVIRLYHIKDCGSLDKPTNVREYWNMATYLDEFERPYNGRVYRGPLFNAHGGTDPDWDPKTRIPIIQFTLDADFGFDHSDISSGKFMKIIESWTVRSGKDQAQRIYDAAKERGKKLEYQTNQMVGSMAEDLWREANNNDGESPMMAKKHAKEEWTPQYKAYKEGKTTYEDYFTKHLPKKVLDKVNG